jgi:hypothetical protein
MRTSSEAPAKVFVRWRGQSGIAVKILNFAREYDHVTP